LTLAGQTYLIAAQTSAIAKEIPMRVLALAIVAIGAVSASGPAAAQPRDNYPICLRVYGPATYDECRYVNMAQCAATASGRAAQCYTNPFFASAEAPMRPRRHRHEVY
jgi:Protein of unknown function (DUF3551)